MKRCMLVVALVLFLSPLSAASPGQQLKGVIHYIWRDQGTENGGLRLVLTADDGSEVTVAPAPGAGPPVPLSAGPVELTGYWAQDTAHRFMVTNWGPTLTSKTNHSLSHAKPLAAQIGPRPWLIILCRFNDDPSTPFPLDYYNRLLSPTYPGLDHYWQEVSFGSISLAGSRAVGWYTLPRARSYYVHDGIFEHGRAFQDATALADAAVYFPTFSGISLVFNNLLGERDVDKATAYGGQMYGRLDNVSRNWGVTWIPANMRHWVFSREMYPIQHVFAHEMGHALGLPHSTGPYGFNYDNYWDVMSYWGASVSDPDFGLLGIHTIAYHKDLLGWLPEDAKETVPTGEQVTLRIDRLAQPSDAGRLMVKVPVAGKSNRYYTLEYRQRFGYDRGLYDDGVVIHDIDTGRYEVNINWGVNEWHPAHVVDVDNDGDTGDDGAVWQPGEVFTDPDNGISVRVESMDASGAWVTVNNNASLFSDFVEGPDIDSTLLLLNASRADRTSGRADAWAADGQPWPIRIDGQVTEGTFEFALPPLGSGVYSTDSDENIAAGWLHVGSDRPLTGSVLFSSRHGVAAVPASRLSARSVLAPILQDPLGGSRAGVALANPNAQPIDLVLQVRSASGVAELSGAVRLPARGQTVQFVDELFPGLAGREFTGTLDVSAELPLEALAIQLRADPPGTGPSGAQSHDQVCNQCQIAAVGSSSRNRAAIEAGGPTRGYATLPVAGKTSSLPKEPVGDVTTLAGRPSAEGHADGPPDQALFSWPRDAAVDKEGNVFVADSGSHTIRRVDGKTGEVTTFAGLPWASGAADGARQEARFKTPRSLCLDAGGNLFVADSQNHTIRRITPDGVVSTLAGRASEYGSADGPGAEARFDDPSGIAVDRSGVIYISDRDNHVIRKLSTDGTVTTLAGTPGHAGYADGPGTVARFNQPWKIAIDLEGNILVADYRNTAIRKVSTAGEVTTLAGTPRIPGFKDGPAAEALFAFPSGITVVPSGAVYVADGYVIRRISPEGRVSTFAGYPVVQTSSHSPCRVADGVGLDAGFCFSSSIQAGPEGALYVADTSNQTIRKIKPVEPKETIHFPHFAVGEGISSTIVLINPSAASAARGLLRLTDTQGNPLAVGIDGAPPGSEHAFDLPPLGTRVFTPTTTASLAVGSASVESNLPLSGAVLLSGGLGTAGVAAVEPGIRVAVPIECISESGISTGLALFNPGSAPAQVTVRLCDPSGAVLASTAVQLPAGGQLARFPEELFRDQSALLKLFSGSVEAEADQVICGVGLRVVPGELATLPVAVVR